MSDTGSAHWASSLTHVSVGTELVYTEAKTEQEEKWTRLGKNPSCYIFIGLIGNRKPIKVNDT